VSQPDRQLLGLCFKIKESDFPFSAGKLVESIVLHLNFFSSEFCNLNLVTKDLEFPVMRTTLEPTSWFTFHSRPRNSQVKNPAATAHS
jgi:hypothetical protein